MKDESFKEFVLDQLQALEGLASRRMFGGHGLYLGKSFFGILYAGRLYFRVSDATRPAYEQRGMKPFQPNPRQSLKRYLEVPAEIVESRADLTAWALEASRTHDDD